MIKTLTFNGISLSDYGCWYDGSQFFNKPQKMVETYEVIGRNGDIAISQDRYSNITRRFNCHIHKDFKRNYTNLIDMLSSVDGYGRFECSDDPEVYCMALFTSDINADLGQYGRWGNFPLSFNFKPQKYLKSGEIAISVSSTKKLVNPTSQIALPLIKVSGTGTITINSSVLTLATNTSTTVIDCELQDAYEGTINRNPDLTITNGFPVLTKENNITVSGCTIEIIPRWWRL